MSDSRMFASRLFRAAARLSVALCPVVVSAGQIGEAMKAWKDADDLPGLLSAVYDGGELQLDPLGYADLSTHRRMTADDLFWIASNGKAVACALVLTYVDEGRIGLDDPVEKYLPEWRDIKVRRDGKEPEELESKPTVRQLMGHRSGLRFFPEMPISRYPMRLLAHKAVACGLCAQPGEEFVYSNWGIDTAVAICEVVDGESWDVLLKRRVLDPLGMKDTTFFPDREDLKRLAVCYHIEKGAAPQPRPVTQLREPYDKPPVFAEAGGGLFSTAGDMMRFYRMLANHGVAVDGRRFLSERLMNEWYGISPFYQEHPQFAKYTFGTNVEPEKGVIGHGGAYQTTAFANWKRGAVRLYLLQQSGGNDRVSRRREDWNRATAPFFDAEEVEVVGTQQRSGVVMPDVFVGTAGEGHCSPAAAWPFGMVMAGPDTCGPDGSGDGRQSGYQYGDDSVCRFSQLHINGTGCHSLGNLGLLPRIAPAPEGALRSPMDKASERGEPGYYAVRLTDSDVLCEMTVGAHTSAYRFRFPKGARRFLIVDGDWGVAASSARPEPLGGQYIHETAMDFPADDVLVGSARITAWTDYSVFWNIAFSQPVIARRKLVPGHGGRGETWELEFAPGEEPLEVRMGLSSVSAKGAADNLAAEMPRFAFDRQRAAAAAAWSEVLSRVRLGANVDPVVAANFRSALYRLFVQPCDIADAGTTPFYSTLSLWDTYRAAHPLYTILTPERVDGFVASMLRQYRRQGYLPIWALMGNETHCMIGHHAVPVIVDAYLKGFRGFDVETAYEAVTNSLTVSHRAVNNATWGLMKEDWPVYNRLGYVPFDGMEESSGGRRVIGESVSRTLECAYDDACAARFAAALGRKRDEEFFVCRAASWKNVFDPGIGFMRGRDLAGRWRTPFDPYDIGHCWWSNSDFTEGNAWQWTWHVMHDPDGLVAALGGPAKFGARLDELFTADSRKQSLAGTFTSDVTGLIGQYAHGNEPGHHTAYFFRWSDRPARTEELVRTICDTQYAPKPDGLCGNDDCGQMAAWYVFSALGFYPFDPCGGTYVIGAPQLSEATLSLPGGRMLKITARGLSAANRHVKSVMLNGRPLTGYRITHAEILAGGELVFEMIP